MKASVFHTSRQNSFSIWYKEDMSCQDLRQGSAKSFTLATLKHSVMSNFVHTSQGNFQFRHFGSFRGRVKAAGTSKLKVSLASVNEI